MSLDSGPSLHVTLIRPPVLQRPVSLSLYGAVPPIGLAYVASTLQESGHRVAVVDAAGEAIERRVHIESPAGTLLRTGLSDDEIVARVPEDTDVIGITHMFLHEWPTLRSLIADLRLARPGAKIVLGGENATAFWRWMLREAPAIDCCVLGEGEQTMRALCERWAAGADISDLPGLALPGPDGPTSTGLSARNLELESLPRPAWDLLPIDAYLEQRDPHGVHLGRSLPILATRGCPYTCTFCSSPDMWTTRYRTRKPDEVVAEMRDAVARWGIENFNFCDLTAIVRRDWILDFCAKLDAAKLDITWQLPTGTRSEALDADVLEAVHRTGCRNITYAPESGSTRMLKALKKRVKLPTMLDSLSAAHSNGLVTRVNIIIGHPDEQASDVLDSMRLLLQAARRGCDDAAVMVFSPYPGSADFQRQFDAGEVEIDDRYCYLGLTRTGGAWRSWHPRWGPRRLHALQLSMLLGFYGAAYASRPTRIPRALGSLASGQEHTQLDQLLRTKFDQFSRMRSSGST